MAGAATRRTTPATERWPDGVRLARGRAARASRRAATADHAARAINRRHMRGMLAEFAAAALLVLKGYRILDRRHRGRSGEIDIIAVRNRRLAFVEVKYRPTMAEASASISDRQAARIADAAEHWVWRHPRYRDHEIGLDAVLVTRFGLPRHVANALQPT